MGSGRRRENEQGLRKIIVTISRLKLYLLRLPFGLYMEPPTNPRCPRKGKMTKGPTGGKDSEGDEPSTHVILPLSSHRSPLPHVQGNHCRNEKLDMRFETFCNTYS